MAVTLAKLKKRKDFVAMRKAPSFRAKYFLLAFAPSETKNQARVGYIITKKQGNAVTRNRIRRRLQAIISLEQQEVFSNTDYVVVARASVAKAPFSRLKDEMRTALSFVQRRRRAVDSVIKSKQLES